MLVYNARDRDPRVWNQARSLIAAGAHVDVFMLRRDGQAIHHRDQEGFNVTRFSVHSPKSRRPWVFVPGYWQLFRSVGSHYDVVHCHDASTLPAGRWLARRFGAPLVYDAHEYFPDHRPSRVHATWLERLREKLSVNLLAERLLISKADVVTTVSPGIARLLEGRYHLRAAPVVLRNALPYQTVTPAEPGLRQILGLDEQIGILLFQGAVTPRRGLELSLRVLKELPTVYLVTLGPVTPGYEEEALAEAKALGVADRFKMLPPVPFEKLLPLTASADLGIYLLPTKGLTLSYRYSLPNKLFEYVMARVPVVMSNLPEIEDVLTRYQVGVAVNPHDPLVVAGQVARLLEERRERSDLRERLERAADELSWDVEERMLLVLYESLPRR